MNDLVRLPSLSANVGAKAPPRSDEPRLDASAWTRADARPIALREVMHWEPERQRLLLRIFLPIGRLVQFGVDPVTLLDPQGLPVIRTTFAASEQSMRLEIYHRGDARDPMVEIEISDTPYNQIEVNWLTLQDPLGPRYDIDIMPDGQPTLRGVARRNIAAEIEAMNHGLAPGQIRRGLGEFDQALERMETFMLCLNRTSFVVQPLYYHTAVLFERFGFSYLVGQERMEAIAAGFAPNGTLRALLDGSSPFRRPELADTVRGRSWAIHDGILDTAWDRVRMIKRLGVHAHVDTCPGVPW